MSIILLLSLIFVETLTALIGFVAAVFAYKEYRSRRKISLIFFGSSYLFNGLTFTLLFGLQIVAIFQGDIGWVASAVPYIYVLGSMSGILALIGLVNLYVRRGLQKTLYGVIGGGLFTMLALSFSTGIRSVQVENFPLVLLGIGDALRLLSGAMLAFVMLVIAPSARLFLDRLHKRPSAPANVYMLLSGVAGIAYLLGRIGFSSTGNPLLLILSFVFMVAVTILSLTAVLAWDHPDKRVYDRPFLVYSKSYLLKTIGLNSALFGTLAFILVSFTAVYFVRLTLDNDLGVISSNLRLRAYTQQMASSELEKTAVHLASIAQVKRVVVAPDVPANVSSTEDVLRSLNDNASIRVMLIDGTVVASSEDITAQEFDAEEKEMMRTSSVFIAALGGKASTLFEEDLVDGVVSLHSAAPVRGEDGAVVGVVFSSASPTALTGGLPIEASRVVVGHGIVTKDGTLIFEAGRSLDVVTRYDFSRTLFGREEADGVTKDGIVYFLVRVVQPDGSADGYLYAYSTETVLNAEATRILALIALLSMLGALLFIAVLGYFTSRSLVPVRKLAKASREIGHGNFNVEIDYHSMDELGTLSDAFNHMTETIGEQTMHLKEALREQKDFLMHTAQEMRTPLNHFRWTLEMLRFGEVGALNQEQLEMVDQLNRTSDRLQRMVQNIMDANRLTEGAMRPKFAAMSLEDVIDDVAGSVVVDVRRKNINLHWRYPQKPLPKVNADVKMMHRILTNLLTNAVKYTGRDGHIEVSLKEVDERKPGGRKGAYLQVSIEDNGLGIPVAEHPRVFSLFYRSPKVVKADIEGAGLGLFIVKSLVKLHKGAIWFESEEDKGSTFTFTIPKAGGDQEQGDKKQDV